MLRVAVPNKGSLSEAATAMLADAGYSGRRDSKTLVHRDGDNDIEFFYLRPRDIAVYIGEGILDLGITGLDLMLDSGADAQEVTRLGFASSTFRYAAPEGGIREVAELAGRRIATSYPRIVEADLAARGIEARTVPLDGAVEVSVELGVADAIADVVQTGSTLRAAGLEVFGEPILRSEAILINRKNTEVTPQARVMVRRLESVLVARRYVLMDYDVPGELLERTVAVTPGFESPTISPLQDPDWFAVRSMVPTADSARVMDELYSIGARAILVTRIGACRV